MRRGSRPEGRPLGFEGVECVLGRRIEEQRSVARGDQLRRAVLGSNNPTDEGHELFGRKIVVQQRIQVIQQRLQIGFGGESGARVRAAGGHHEGGADAMAGDVGDRDRDAAIVELLPVVIVSARFVGRLIPASDLKTRDNRRRAVGRRFC